MSDKICSVEDCGSRVLAKGFCSRHYDRMRRLGSTDLPARISDRYCAECGTRRAAYDMNGGVCQVCYRRLRRNPVAIAPRTCGHCGIEYTPKRKFSEESGRGTYCSRDCKEAARRERGDASYSAIKSMYKTKYNLTMDEVAAMRAKGCGICGSMGGTGRWGNLHIDHDHRTGRIRGALCHDCNLGIGRFKDDVTLLLRAVEYLTAA